jgi:phosphoglycerate dehydrogenase-like enzyme
MSMRQGATFINTARPDVVRQDELIAAAFRRADLQFVLDVASPEPPEAESPLYTLPNVLLTPHIAGSVGQECRRMGRYMAEELERFVSGRPLRWAVTPEAVWNTSHRPTAAREAKLTAATPAMIRL